jgi:hypothetical protein
VLLVMALMIAMMLGGLGLLGCGLHAALADHARQKRFATAAACAAGASAAESRRSDCVARGVQRVTYVSTMKDTNRDTVYVQDAPIMAEDNHLAAALLGVMFACYGGAVALGCVRRGFAWGARLYRRSMRMYDVIVAELTIFAFAAMAGAILVGRGDAAYGIVLPLIAIPVASVAATFTLRARFRRDLLRLAALRPAGPVPDLE